MTQWDAEIDSITEAFKSEFGGLSSEQMNWKPNPNTWSIAQNIEHLWVVNESYFPALDSLNAGTYRPSFVARFEFMVQYFENLILNAVEPKRTKKIKTFAIWQPNKSELPDSVLSVFEKHQGVLKQKMNESQGIVKKRSIISSPANRSIVYRIDKAFDIIDTHEKRHLEQAKEVKALLK
jgi:hypothetical protein